MRKQNYIMTTQPPNQPAIKSCNKCFSSIDVRATVCPICRQSQYHAVPIQPRKEYWIYVLLTLLFPGLGVNQLYAGRTGAFICYLILTILTCGLWTLIYCFLFIWVIDLISKRTPNGQDMF